MFYKLTYPWESISSIIKNKGTTQIANNLWCFQIMNDGTDRISNASTGELFPTKKLKDHKEILELPGPSIKGDSSRQIKINIEENTHDLEFFQTAESGIDPQNNKSFEIFFDKILDNLLSIFREGLKVDKTNKQNVYWEELIYLIDGKKDDDPAKYALVVDLSRPLELTLPVNLITDKPKHVLRRIYGQERLNKVREVDVKCIIDLSRRPGSVVVEKAGKTQSIMAVKRTGDINILENRVTKHCCNLVNKAATRYLEAHTHIDTESSRRKKEVERLLVESKIPLRKKTFQGVSSLNQPCRMPNYTLMKNPEYHKVWQAYSKLVKNEDIRADLWKWNRRMWTDYCALFLSYTLLSYKESSDSLMIEIGKKTVYGKRNHVKGSSFVSDVFPGPFILNPDSISISTLYFIDCNYESLKKLDDSLIPLSLLNADYLFIIIHPDKKIVLPVYCILTPNHFSKDEHREYLSSMDSNLKENISYFNENDKNFSCKQGWILLGNWAMEKVDSRQSGSANKIKSFLSDVPPDFRDWQNSIQRHHEPLINFCTFEEIVAAEEIVPEIEVTHSITRPSSISEHTLGKDKSCMEIENTLRSWAGQGQLELNWSSVHANVLKKVKALGLPNVTRTIESGNKKGKVVTEYGISPELRLGITRELALEMGLLVPASSTTK